ncbi:hypothetical protein [Asticcacaulis sp.]|uniref:hypothetical protein n=1 Tax=Asticcacaulis sp. TaxID=1872648 RepID=UPI002BAA3535|nr:hypothetical protein [Asticcacaulis sp.]HTM80596.1 hypothetical protein [Asticcacaulis sp.]
MEHANTPIATPEQRQALRRNQQQRLRDQAEALLRAVEVLEPPTTYKEAEQAAKTLLVVGKVLDAVNTETRDDLPTKPAWVTTADPIAEQAALTTWQAVLNHSLETLAIARRTAREGAP